VTGAYALFATLWILLSDRAIGALFPDPDLLVKWSVFKGLGFVAVTSILLFFLMRGAFGRLESSYRALEVHQQEIERLQRLYAALSQINQAIVWTGARDDLFHRICDVLVRFGGFRMVWIGEVDEDRSNLVPVAAAGNPGIDMAPIPLPAGPEEAEPCLSPVFRASTSIHHDITAHPDRRFAPAKEPLTGIRAHGSFPIRTEGRVTGILNVYATEPEMFEDKEIALLEEAVIDISFALDNIEREKQRQEAQKALEKSEARYRTTLESILEGCQIIGHDWEYLYLNPTAAVHNRRPNDELLGKRMPDMWPGIEETRLFSLIQRCMEERVPSHEETEFLFPDGSTGWFDVRTQPVPEGIFILSIDITERHEAELALRSMNENLEREVAKRTGELETALLRAEAADRLKSAFLATVSHELRTPLNSIIGFTGILMKELPGPLNAEQQKQLGMVQGSARHLLELINDVLDLSKIEAGQLEVRPETFDLRDSVERIVSSIEPLAKKEGLQLKTSGLDSVDTMTSDRRRIEQILLNLLGNAVKFTKEGGVTLTIEPVDEFVPEGRDPRSGVRFVVEDTGIGIPSRKWEALFQPFCQIDNSLSREQEGTGLGLAICHRLTSLLGGEIDVASEWAKGSTFTVTLPQHHETET